MKQYINVIVARSSIRQQPRIMRLQAFGLGYLLALRIYFPKTYLKCGII